ncbi:MAG: MarP family serine protease [Nitriliruptorales bacterium]|nr:MarP family serine protease [Nitriliruptorales bacterium]
MNLLDLMLLTTIATTAWSGWRLGLVTRGTSFVGLAAGLGLAAWLAPPIVGLVEHESASTRLLVLALTVFGSGMVGSTIGQVIGLRLRRRWERTTLATVDQLGGAAAGVLSVLVLIWLLLPVVADVPGVLAEQVRGSALVQFVDDNAPEPPDTVHALRRLVSQSRFPDVFADLQQAPEVGPPPDQIPVPQGVVAAATASTMNIEATGCGARFEGSGFVVAAERVVTNAHVVAGVESLRVRLPDGPLLDADVIAFDGDADLALLAVPGLDRPALPIRDVPEGTEGAVIGYPGGQDTPRIAPAAIRREQRAVGRDIYGNGRTERDILVLSSRLRQGDSGSAMIDDTGAVVGVVFAVSPDDRNTAFALDVTELNDFLAAGPTGGPGPCI